MYQKSSPILSQMQTRKLDDFSGTDFWRAFSHVKKLQPEALQKADAWSQNIALNIYSRIFNVIFKEQFCPRPEESRHSPALLPKP